MDRPLRLKQLDYCFKGQMSIDKAGLWRYRAYSTVRTSRITVIFISPG